MSIAEKLTNIQCGLKAPKNQYNSFGKYKYRSCEDILEAVKPLLKEHGLSLHIYDEVTSVNDRIYIVARAKLIDIETNESIVGSAMARESLTKKGMDESQITGTASSYARKYALNGLFLIDDTKDADTDEFSSKDTLITKAQVNTLKRLIPKHNSTVEQICKACSVDSLEELTLEKFNYIMYKMGEK